MVGYILSKSCLGEEVGNLVWVPTPRANKTFPMGKRGREGDWLGHMVILPTPLTEPDLARGYPSTLPQPDQT